MNVDLLIKENKELSEEKQRYKEMWFFANNSLSKYRDLEEEFPFSIEKMQEVEYVYVLENCDKLKKYKLIGFNFKEKQIYFWMDFCPMYLSFDEYKKLFWLKEDKSE